MCMMLLASSLASMSGDTNVHANGISKREATHIFQNSEASYRFGSREPSI